MNRLSSCLIAAAVAASAFPAVAQDPPTLRTPPGSILSRVQTYRPYVSASPATRAEFENMLDSATGNNIGPQSLERIDLANRVDTLIELGRCTDARNAAMAAGDRQMAIRARQLCRRDRNPSR
jgi:hypothetical protein